MPQPKLYRNRATRQKAYRRRRERARTNQVLAKGLPSLPAIATMPGTARWTQDIIDATHLLTVLEEEMRDYYGEHSPEQKEEYKGDQHKERMQAIHRVIAALENVSF